MNIPIAGQQGPSSSTSTVNRKPYSDSEIAKLLLLESQTYTGSENSILTGKSLKTNKRFLKSVIRNVNDHNRQLERRPESSLTPTRAAEEEDRRRDRREDERRRRITEQGSHDGRSRHSSSHHHRTASRGTRDDAYSASRISPRPSEVSRSQTHHHSSSTRREQWERSGSSRDLVEENRKRVDKEKRRRTRDRDSEDAPHSSTLKQHSVGKTRKEEREPSNLANAEEGHQLTAGDGTLPTRSKMDKYFAASYDPRLDVNLDDITDPQTGIIHGGNYDDWEKILAQMKAKRDERAREKDCKLQEKLKAAQRKLRKSEKKERRSLKKRKKTESCSDDELDALDRERRRRKRREEKKKERRDPSVSKSKPNSSNNNNNNDGHDGDREKVRREKGKQQDHIPDSESDFSSSSSSHSSTSSSSDNHHRHRHRRHRGRSSKNHLDNKSAGLIAFNGFSKLGTLREWDRGKPSPT